MSEIVFGEGSATEVLASLHPSAAADQALSIGSGESADQVLVARSGDAVVGYLAARTEPMGGLLIWEHFVVPEYRDRGIGRRLLLEAARRLPPTLPITIDPIGDFAIDTVARYYGRLGFPSVVDDRFKVSVKAHVVVDAIGERNEEDITLETILRRKPSLLVTIDPDAPLAEAVALLNDRNVGSVVVSADGELIDGILSERDVVVGVHERGAEMLGGRVRDYMTTEVVSVETSDAVAQVMELATVRRHRHLPVTEAGKLVGVVSVGDLLVSRMREHDMRREALPLRNS